MLLFELVAGLLQQERWTITGLDKVKAHSRHAAIGTLLIYADEHDRQGTQRMLGDLVAGLIAT